MLHISSSLRWTAISLFLFCLGCKPDFRRLDLDLDSYPPNPSTVELSSDFVRLPMGIAISVRATPRSAGAIEYDEDVDIQLYTDNSEIARVYPTEYSNIFVIVGSAPGQTLMHVRIDGDREDAISIEVAGPRDLQISQTP